MHFQKSVINATVAIDYMSSNPGSKMFCDQHARNCFKLVWRVMSDIKFKTLIKFFIPDLFQSTWLVNVKKCNFT